MAEPIADGSPWYRYFWPWFIVVLLGVSIVGSLVTVTIAYRLGDLESGADHTIAIEPPTGSTAKRASPGGDL